MIIEFEAMEVAIVVLVHFLTILPVLGHVFNIHHVPSIELKNGLDGGKHAITGQFIQMFYLVQDSLWDFIRTTICQHHACETISQHLPVQAVIIDSVGFCH